jgi:hypothetical protein
MFCLQHMLQVSMPHAYCIVKVQVYLQINAEIIVNNHSGKLLPFRPLE